MFLIFKTDINQGLEAVICRQFYLDPRVATARCAIGSFVSGCALSLWGEIGTLVLVVIYIQNYKAE